MLNSVWSENTSLPQFPRLEQDIRTDVLIIGGGLAGLLTAYKLTQAGVDCLLIEADALCHGISRNTTAKITSQHGLIYGRILKEFGSDTARLYWEANEAALEKLGIPAKFAEHLPLPFPVAGAVRFQNQAQFHPLKLAAGIARELNIREHTRAIAVDGNTVTTDCGKITAEKIIVATHFPFINTHGGYFLKLYQDRSYVIGLENAPDLDGMYLDEAKDGLSFRNYNQFLLLGGGGHRTGKPSGGWNDLCSIASQYYPNAEVRFRWAAQDCMTLDGIPYVGRYSRRTPNLYVATGFQKWGMTSSMAAADLLCDLVRDIQNPYAPVFSPSRRILRPQLFVNTAEAVRNLLTPATPRCPHLGCALKWNPQEHSWDCPCHGSRFAEDGILLDNPATGNLE